jgi:hypothetical protein
MLPLTATGLAFLTRLPRCSTPRSSLWEGPVQISHRGSQGITTVLCRPPRIEQHGHRHWPRNELAVNLLLEVIRGSADDFMHALKELFIVVDAGQQYRVTAHLDKDRHEPLRLFNQEHSPLLRIALGLPNDWQRNYISVRSGDLRSNASQSTAKDVPVTQRGEGHQIGRSKPTDTRSTLLPAVLKFHLHRPISLLRLSQRIKRIHHLTRNLWAVALWNTADPNRSARHSYHTALCYASNRVPCIKIIGVEARKKVDQGLPMLHVEIKLRTSRAIAVPAGQAHNLPAEGLWRSVLLREHPVGLHLVLGETTKAKRTPIHVLQTRAQRVQGGCTSIEDRLPTLNRHPNRMTPSRPGRHTIPLEHCWLVLDDMAPPYQADRPFRSRRGAPGFIGVHDQTGRNPMVRARSASQRESPALGGHASRWFRHEPPGWRWQRGRSPRAGLTGRAIRVPHRRVNPGPQRTATVNLAGP